QAQAHAHWQRSQIAGGRRPMRRWRRECGARLRQREAESMIDLAGGYFVVANQTGEDWESGGVRRSPRVGTLLVAQQRPHGGLIGVPASVGIHRRVIQLIE